MVPFEFENAEDHCIQDYLHVSLALFMRLGLVSVVGKFLWSGERSVDHDVQYFPGGH